MKNTIQDLNVFLSKSQNGILDALTNENPLLASIPVKAATHGIYNVYTSVKDIDELAEVDFDAELPAVGVSFELGQANLAKIGGTLPIPQDAANLMGGYDQYANGRIPKIIAKAGNAHEARLYYNGFMKYALQNGKVINGGGTTANKQFSMIAVHFDSDSVTGLYNGTSVNNGKLFTIQALNGGADHKVSALNGAIGRELAIYLHYGLQLADPRYVKAIVNIEAKANTTDRDKIDGLPTGMMMDDLINDVQGNPANTVIYCAPIVLRYMANKFNLQNRTVIDSQSDIRYDIVRWNGIPFVASYNIFNGTEAVVNVS